MATSWLLGTWSIVSSVTNVTSRFRTSDTGAAIVPDVVSDSAAERHVFQRYGVLSSAPYRATRSHLGSLE